MPEAPSSRWESKPAPRTWRQWLGIVVGPGMVMAATGVGASDFVSAVVNGGKFGLSLLWIIVAGAILKGLINEGLARWQLVTDTTIVEAWCQRLHPAVRYIFLVYLLVWTFFLGGSLSSACGMAGHAILPLPCSEGTSIAIWGGIHLVGAAALVFVGHYRLFETLMSGFVAVMFVGTVAGAILTAPDWGQVLRGMFVPSAIPEGSIPNILATIGGLGGSVTVLCYSYWLIEAKRTGSHWRKATVADLVLSYVLTALFGIGVMIMSAQVFYPKPDIVESRGILIQLANALRERVGPAGYWFYALGFWGAVSSTALGCAHGIPYLFSHLAALIRQVPQSQHAAYTSPTSRWYRGFLLYVTFPPLVWLIFKRPVFTVFIFTVLASLITPFIAATLLYLNNRRDWVGKAKYGWLTNLILGLALALLLYLMAAEVCEQWVKVKETYFGEW